MKISFLIPCYNEEKTIGKCIQSVLGQSREADEIIVINDGSGDKSRQIISSFKRKGVKVIHLKENTGNKSKAIEIGLKQATGDIIAFTDADSFLDFDFLNQAVKHFKNPEVGAVNGKIISNKNNWLTSVRGLEYVIGQEIHKSGQAALGSIFVVPGCCGIFRKSVLDKITLDHDTVTEDLDITLKVHKLKKKIIFEPKAIVYTNDPYDLKSYIRQIKRWHSGAFQNIRKHKDILGKGWLGRFEIPATIFEGLFFGSFYLISPILLIWHPSYVLSIYAIDFSILLIFCLYGVLKLKRLDLLKGIMPFFGIRIINNVVWLWAFFNVIILKKNEMTWYRAKR